MGGDVLDEAPLVLTYYSGFFNEMNTVNSLRLKIRHEKSHAPRHCWKFYSALIGWKNLKICHAVTQASHKRWTREVDGLLVLLMIVTLRM